MSDHHLCGRLGLGLFLLGLFLLGLLLLGLLLLGSRSGSDRSRSRLGDHGGGSGRRGWGGSSNGLRGDSDSL